MASWLMKRRGGLKCPFRSCEHRIRTITIEGGISDCILVPESRNYVIFLNQIILHSTFSPLCAISTPFPSKSYPVRECNSYSSTISFIKKKELGFRNNSFLTSIQYAICSLVRKSIKSSKLSCLFQSIMKVTT